MGIYLGAGEGSLDYDEFMATNIAGWNAEKRGTDARVWADAW